MEADIRHGVASHLSGLSDRLYRECIAALGSHGDEAAFVLDDHGKVVFCNRECADVLRRDAGEIVGRHIKSFIPAIPLHARRPGNNVATASHWGRHNRWQPCRALNPNGDDVRVELRLDVVVAGYRYLILAWARPGPAAGMTQSTGVDAGSQVIESPPAAGPCRAIRRQLAPPRAQATAAISATMS